MQYEDELSTSYHHICKMQRGYKKLKYAQHLQKKAYDEILLSMGASKTKHNGNKLKRGREEAEGVSDDELSRPNLPTILSSKGLPHDQRVRFARTLTAQQSDTSTSFGSKSNGDRNSMKTTILPIPVASNTSSTYSKVISYEEPVGILLSEGVCPPSSNSDDSNGYGAYHQYAYGNYGDAGDNGDYANYNYNAADCPISILNTPPTTSTTSALSNPPKPTSTPQHPVRQDRCIEVVRNRTDRAALPGHTCAECEAFYHAMVQQGIVTEENKKMFLQSCSRHKARWTPPSTPEGYWDLSLHTPKEWKK